MAPSVGEVLAQAKDPGNRRTATARVLLRQNLLQRHAELDARLTATIEADSQHNREPLAPALQEEIEALEAEIEAEFVTFKFANVGHRKWADLLGAHAPTKAQLQEYPRLEFNPETFPVSAVAASCTEPEMTLAEAQELETLVSDSQFEKLWIACLDANTGGLEAPKSLAAGVIRLMNARSASTRAPAASPDQSSLAE